MKKAILVFLRILAYALLAFGLVLLLAVFWLFKVFPHVSFEELMYQITAPITGTNQSMIVDFIQCVIVPASITLLVTMLCMFLIRKHKRVRYFMRTCIIALSVFCIGFSTSMAFNRLDVLAYYNNQSSDFMEKYYVNPSGVNITFPEQKKNLLLIYLESMEMTYADASVGGSFEENLIPELTQIAQENYNFSGTDSTVLNGAIPLSGTTWTAGALFGSSSGLPLNISINGNLMDQQESFFPDITTMGDILEDNGYRNIFMCGTDAVFGGRELFFKTHGDFEIYDYNYYLKNGSLPSDDYYVFWGFEDSYLLSFAKDKLEEVSQGDQPFNLTMLTVDTHFEDGYRCDLCQDEHGEQYADVMSCSSRQIAAFLSWCKEQDWYENTTIVLTGDHLTMDADFCNNVPGDYQRKVYTAYINSAVEPELADTARSYSTFDTFPTTLAALGAYIEGNCLGLGTNLFSSHSTLLERFGKDEINHNLANAYDFMNRLGKIDTGDFSVLGTITIQAEEMNAYASQDITSEVLSTVHAGEQFEVITEEEKDGVIWYRTRDFQWIAAEDSTVQFEAKDVGEDYLGTLTVMTVIMCRDEPSLNGEIMTSVGNGESYKIIDIQYADGFTWYCAGDGVWIPSEGTWATFEEK